MRWRCDNTVLKHSLGSAPSPHTMPPLRVGTERWRLEQHLAGDIALRGGGPPWIAALLTLLTVMLTVHILGNSHTNSIYGRTSSCGFKHSQLLYCYLVTSKLSVFSPLRLRRCDPSNKTRKPLACGAAIQLPSP